MSARLWIEFGAGGAGYLRCMERAGAGVQTFVGLDGVGSIVGKNGAGVEELDVSFWIVGKVDSNVKLLLVAGPGAEVLSLVPHVGPVVELS